MVIPYSNGHSPVIKLKADLLFARSTHHELTSVVLTILALLLFKIKIKMNKS